jgi:hypothetical protein
MRSLPIDELERLTHSGVAMSAGRRQTLSSMADAASMNGIERSVLLVGFVLAIVSGVAAYHASGPYGQQPAARVHRIYDPATGRLAVLVYDASGNGVFDTRTFMDGERRLRKEVDENEDGLIDRIEYFGPDDKISRVERVSGAGADTQAEGPKGF